MDEDLDALVRRVDEDRWLASRFAPPDVRARLIALYALNHEIARVAETVKTAAVGDIRLAWWREALAEVHAGAPLRPHPMLAAYAQAHTQMPFPAEVMERLIDARRRDLDADPFAAAAERSDYLDATAGGLMRLAIAACGGIAGEHVAPAAQAWGCAGLLRAEPSWRARGRSVLAPGETLEVLEERARAAVVELRALPKARANIFPGIGYVALTPLYLDALKRKRADVPLLRRHLALVAAAATGRF